ncbi:MAG: MFS transporter [Verrucomicrobia bacterium]|nr:MFS transporter [Verrucomicrobiota bacterium]
MNMMGNFGGMLGPLAVGFILASSKPTPAAPPTMQGWTAAFLVAAALYVVGGVAWLCIDPVTPLESEAKQ